MVIMAQNTEIMPGYKLTEVGVIPEDWKVTKLGEVANIKTGPFGSALHEKDYVDDGTPIITVEHLGELGVVYENMPMVSEDDRKRLKAYSLLEGDIVFSRVGSVDRNCLIKAEESNWLFSGRLLRIRLKTTQVYTYFLSYYFKQETAKQRIRNVAVGQTMASLNTQILKNVDIVFPPTIREQQAIATALSDVDALITSFDKLIVKKRDIKQATMQQLLTGKTRLPGFDGKWETKTIEEIAALQRGFDLPTSQLKERIYPVVYSNGVLNHHSSFKVKAPGVVTGRSGTIGKVNYIEDNYWPHNTSLWVTNFKGNLPKFVYYMYISINLEKFGTGSGVPTLNRNDVHSHQISIPAFREQQAIATVLSGMDAEVVALEHKREKTRMLKQGMIQELLSGKTRLL